VTTQPGGREGGAVEDAAEAEATRVRQGEIILKKPWQRWVFFGGLVGIIALAILLPLLWWAFN
jgi:hypothetical protein